MGRLPSQLFSDVCFVFFPLNATEAGHNCNLIIIQWVLPHRLPFFVFFLQGLLALKISHYSDAENINDINAFSLNTEDFGTWLLSLTQMSLAMFPQVGPATCDPWEKGIKTAWCQDRSKMVEWYIYIYIYLIIYYIYIYTNIHYYTYIYIYLCKIDKDK